MYRFPARQAWNVGFFCWLLLLPTLPHAFSFSLLYNLFWAFCHSTCVTTVFQSFIVVLFRVSSVSFVSECPFVLAPRLSQALIVNTPISTNSFSFPFYCYRLLDSATTSSELTGVAASSCRSDLTEWLAQILMPDLKLALESVGSNAGRSPCRRCERSHCYRRLDRSSESFASCMKVRSSLLCL